MSPILEELLKDKDGLEITHIMVEFNRHFLERKEHIKKYYRLRRLHGDILSSMFAYIESGKYDIQYYLNQVAADIFRETDVTSLHYDLYDDDDGTILEELFIYKNHEKISSLTEIYLEKKIFRNKEKVKMLHCMKNSYASLFKIVDADRKNGYVTYQDVFTKKRFRVIDVAMSSCFVDRRDIALYTYNRIITVDDISFCSGIHCVMTSKNKDLMAFIKKHRYQRCRDFSRCVMLYDISKKEKNLTSSYQHQYGKR